MGGNFKVANVGMNESSKKMVLLVSVHLLKALFSLNSLSKKEFRRGCYSTYKSLGRLKKDFQLGFQKCLPKSHHKARPKGITIFLTVRNYLPH